MEDPQSILEISITWRGKKFALQMSPSVTLKELGHEMQKLTNVKAVTLRFIGSQLPDKTPTLLNPFSEEHERLSLHETSIAEGKPVRMMGVSPDEVEEVLQAQKLNLRIAGFAEEEKRLRQRTSERSHSSLKLPQGPYIFCDFRTLQLPGIELKPPASEALKRMHMLASDPGIVAIMNKHRWRVGIMTEMAPIGYVGVSPACVLGLNKNQGEEISLRLRTDDLKGFRKYESVKKTLLHELAHMVYSDHDANFYALDSQLNKEAAGLDWTRSTGHTLSGVRPSNHYDEESYVEEEGHAISQKLGGDTSDQFASARAASIVAAYRRIANAPTRSSIISEPHEEPDPDDSGNHAQVVKELDADSFKEVDQKQHAEPDPDDHSDYHNKLEPHQEVKLDDRKTLERTSIDEPDPDNMVEKQNNMEHGIITKRNEDNSLTNGTMNDMTHQVKGCEKADLGLSKEDGEMQADPCPGDSSAQPVEESRMQIDEPDPDDEELRRIQDPVTVACSRFQKAIEMLRAEVDPSQTTVVLQILLKIISNVIEHPNETKFRRLRKANPVIQLNIANHKAAIELLVSFGFNEEVVSDDIYFVLKRNDPGLLWLAKSLIESNITS